MVVVVSVTGAQRFTPCLQKTGGAAMKRMDSGSLANKEDRRAALISFRIKDTEADPSYEGTILAHTD